MATVFAVSIFVDILVDVTNTTSAPKIQITLLILRRGALPKLTPMYQKLWSFKHCLLKSLQGCECRCSVTAGTKQQDGKDPGITT